MFVRISSHPLDSLHESHKAVRLRHGNLAEHLAVQPDIIGRHSIDEFVVFYTVFAARGVHSVQHQRRHDISFEGSE